MQKNFARAVVCIFGSLYNNYDLGGSQMKKRIIFGTPIPKLKRGQLEIFRQITSNTGYWAPWPRQIDEKIEISQAAVAVYLKKICQFQNYIFCRLLCATALYSVLSHCTTVHYSQQTLSLLTHSTAAAAAKLRLE